MMNIELFESLKVDIKKTCEENVDFFLAILSVIKIRFPSHLSFIVKLNLILLCL